jgi:hypothetical protein
MASKAVVDAVQARLAAHWTACPIFKENEQGVTPDDGTPWLLLQFPVATTRNMTVGSRAYREEGGFRIVINIMRGTGSDLMFEWGDQIAAIFRDVKENGIEYLTPTSPFTDDQSDQGAFFTGSIVCEYSFNFVSA